MIERRHSIVVLGVSLLKIREGADWSSLLYQLMLVLEWNIVWVIYLWGLLLSVCWTRGSWWKVLIVRNLAVVIEARWHLIWTYNVELLSWEGLELLIGWLRLGLLGCIKPYGTHSGCLNPLHSSTVYQRPHISWSSTLILRGGSIDLQLCQAIFECRHMWLSGLCASLHGDARNTGSLRRPWWRCWSHKTLIII